MCKRCNFQYIRKISTHVTSAIILLSGGVVIGLMRSLSQDLQDVPSSMCLVSTVMAVLSSANSLSYFGSEKIQHRHESRMGALVLRLVLRSYGLRRLLVS